MDVPKFDTLDIPCDIEFSLDEKNLYYIFHDIRNNIYFRLLIDNNTLKRCICSQDGTINKTIICQEDNISDINDYLWKISNEKYNLRYIKLEVIERIRSIDDNLQLKRLLDFLKNNFNMNYRDNSID